jgi:hypothetical protein
VGPAAPRPATRARAKFELVMLEFEEGVLFTSSGEQVRSKSQAVAIALRAAEKAGRT